MPFYYNIDERICAEEKWVAGYLYNQGAVESEEEAIEELRTCREFYGWFECTVSDTIKTLIHEHYGIYH